MQKSKLPVQVWIILVPVLLIVLVSALLPLLAPMGSRPAEDKWSGPFYSNPDDPALLVPKRYGIGYTLNFGNRWSWLVLALILLLAMLPLLLTAVNIHNLPGRIR